MRLNTALPTAIVTFALTILFCGTAYTEPADTAMSAANQNTVRNMSQRFDQNDIEFERLFGGYRKVKQLAPPAESILNEVEPLENKMYEAYGAGDKGEARRLLHQAFAVLTEREWTPKQELARSLILRTNMAVADPGQPMTARLDQLFRPASPPQGPLRIRVLLLNPRTPQRTPPIKNFGLHENESSNLIDKPFSFTLDVKDVKDGKYLLGVEVLDGEETLRRLTTPVCLIRDFESTQKKIEKELKTISRHESLKATIRYPFDLAKQINLGANVFGLHDIYAGAQRSEKLLAALKEGTDPLWGATGDHTRHYRFDETGEILPYRIYVPTKYDASRTYPLIVALHGGGGNENTMIGGPKSQMKTLAEKHGYIVAAPSAYRAFGGYGKEFDEKAAPELAHMTRLSEIDVLNVLKLVRAEYNVDPSRIFLMGHSMGGNGTWRLGAKYADIWAGLAPVASGQATPEGFAHGTIAPGLAMMRLTTKPYDFEAIRHIPVFVCHGVLDPRAPIENARAMVAAMKELGMNYAYFEKADGTHAMVQPSLAKIFDFFNRVKGKRNAASIK